MLYSNYYSMQIQIMIMRRTSLALITALLALPALAVEKVPETYDDTVADLPEEIPATNKKAEMKADEWVEEVKLSDEKRKSLHYKSKKLLKNIPADGLSSSPKQVRIREGVNIQRSIETSPFSDSTDTGVGGVALDFTDKKRSENISFIEMMQDGRAALLSGHNESAISYYKGALKRSPDNLQALFGLANAYHRNGQLEEAKLRYTELILNDHDNIPALTNYIILLTQEDSIEAVKELHKLERTNPEFSPIPAQLGMIYLEQGDMETAAKKLSRAVLLSPENLQYRYNLAVVMDKMGQVDYAIKMYKHLIAAERKGYDLPAPRHEILDRLAYIATNKALGNPHDS